MGGRYLAIYLRDHFAASVAGVEVTRRSLDSNRGTEYEPFFERMLREISQDQGSLASIMRRLRIAPSPVKASAAWLAEKVGRLKLNGRLVGYSPLSRVIELELLGTGVAAKAAMWKTLHGLRERLPDLQGVDLDALIRRADEQAAEVERVRRRAIQELVPSAPAGGG